MKQKHKSKIHPFVTMLQPGEYLLWLQSARPKPETKQPSKNGYAWIVVLALICGAVAALSAPSSQQFAVFLQTLFLCGSVYVGAVIAVAVGLLALLVFSYLRYGVGLNVKSCAVTNQRLLFRTGLYSAACPLSEVRKVMIDRAPTQTRVHFEFVGQRLSAAGKNRNYDAIWVWECANEDVDELIEAFNTLSSIPVSISGGTQD